MTMKTTIPDWRDRTGQGIGMAAVVPVTETIVFPFGGGGGSAGGGGAAGGGSSGAG
jgi:hypothetical protein